MPSQQFNLSDLATSSALNIRETGIASFSTSSVQLNQGLMLHHVRTALPRLQPSLRISRNVNNNSKLSICKPFQSILPSLPVTARFCSSSPQDKDMASKHLEASHERIFENNRKWVDLMKAEDPEFFVKLSAGQSPEYLYARRPLSVP